jgi:hypothetical protein
MTRRKDGAERGGFEPPIGFDTYNGLANRESIHATPNPTNQLRPNSGGSAHSLPIDNRQTPELRSVIDAWPGLSEPIRAAILAIVRTSTGSGGGR